MFFLNFILKESAKNDLRKICGKKAIRKAKIVGGEDAILGEYPWLVITGVSTI